MSTEPHRSNELQDGKQRDGAGPADLIITGARMYGPGDDGIPVLGKPCRIECAGGVITAITRVDEAASDGAPTDGNVLHADGLVAVPGFINGHTHAAMTLLRGAVEDVPIDRWFNDYIWPMEVNLTARDAYLGTMLAAAEMISGGTTCFVDHYFHMNEVARAVEESGMRANLGAAFFSSQGSEGLDASVEFAEAANGGAGGRITTSVAPHATYTVDDGDLAAAADHALRLGVPVHIHAAEILDQTNVSLERHGVTPIEVLRRTGVLDAGVIIAHGNGILDEDLESLAEGTTGVIHCPTGYLKAGWQRLTPISKLLDAGVPVGLGTDGAASSNSLNVLDSMRMTALTQKQSSGDSTWLTTAQAFALAGPGSAAAVHQPGFLGRLEVGAAADLALFDLSGPHCQPVHDAGSTLLYSARASDVRHTVIAGEVVMRDRRLLTVDLPALIAEITERLPAITDRTHGQTIQTYDT